MDKIYRLVITVMGIRGKCPVFRVGDKIVIQSPEIIPKQTDALCIHALASMLSMLVPLSHGISFRELGLAHEDGNVGYVQCLDPGPPHTPGGTVVFQIKRESRSESLS